MKRFVFAGKGGAGKTTVAAMFLKFISKEWENKKIWVVDADPSATLIPAMGFQKPEMGIGTLKTYLGEQVYDYGVLNKSDVVMQAFREKSMTETKDARGNRFYVSFMGAHEENHCMCSFNSAVNNLIDALYTSDLFDLIVEDREAGVEHVNRSGYSGDNDVVVVVTWPRKDYLMVAEHVLQTLAQVGGNKQKRVLVVNHMDTPITSWAEQLKTIAQTENSFVSLRSSVLNLAAEMEVGAIPSDVREYIDRISSSYWCNVIEMPMLNGATLDDKYTPQVAAAMRELASYAE